MNVDVNDSFNELIKKEWGDIRVRLCPKETDKIKISDIDELQNYPDAKAVVITELTQETFEYFIRTYGKQLRYIDFWKNKLVEDWSLLGTLPDLECIHYFHNQRITKLWDMSKNISLKVICIDDFTRLSDLSGIEKAPALEWFKFGNKVWSTAVIDSMKVFADTKVKRLHFSGKKINDMDLSFLTDMPSLEIFHFPTNLFTTNQVAWVVANRPDLKGYALRPLIQIMERGKEPEVLVVGKRKPYLKLSGNEKRVRGYIDKFEESVKKYRSVPFEEVE